MNTAKFGLLCSLVLLLSGCASLIQDLDYPADLPIVVSGVAYEINTVKCAQINGVDENGTLDCRDRNGMKTAPVSPVSDFRRNLIKQELGLEWGSPEHQAFSYYMIYGGGAEHAAQAIVSTLQQSYGTYASVKNMLSSIDKSKEIDAKSAQLKADGAAAYMRGGLPAWQAHQSKVIQWRLGNAEYFRNQMNQAMQPAIH